MAKYRGSPTDLLTDVTPRLGGRWQPLRLGSKVLDHTARGVSFELALALQTLFPVPRELLPVKELARFKKTYGEMLPLFRSKVHHELGMLSTISEEGARQERLRDLIRAWKAESDAIQRQLEPSGLSFMRRAIIPSMVGLATYALAPDRTDLAAIVPTVCALGQVALEAWTGPGDRRDAVRAQPMAYAALFTRELRGMRR